MESFRTLIAFDLDGTLNQTDLYAVEAYQKTFEELHVGPFSDTEIISRFGAPFKEDIKFFLGDADEDLTELYTKTLLKYWNYYLPLKAKSYVGTQETLDLLKEKGYILAICSNAPEDEIISTLEILKIKSKFEYIQGLTNTINKADSLKVLINKVGAKQTYMVGDRYYDFQAAKMNNACFIGCLYGYGRNELTTANYLIHSITELNTIL